MHASPPCWGLTFGTAHIGSTSAPGLANKPIIDQMLGIPLMEEAHQYVRPLESIGY
jgi:GrpB-like predicted nucleotidyltransferase (UPF0157 family)